MKNSRRQLANAQAEAAKRATGKPAMSKFEAKRRGVKSPSEMYEHAEGYKARLQAHFSGEDQ